MFAYKRLDKIFETVRNAEYTPADKLVDQLEVTERTIRSDVSKINDALAGYGATIAIKRGAGYHLVVGDSEAFSEFQAEQRHAHRTDPDLSTADERMRFLLRELLDAVDYISYDALADKVYVGENTLQNYIRQIKDLLADYDLALMVKAGVGVKILGREDAKRQCFMDNIILRNMQSYVTGLTKDERQLFDDIDLDRLEEIVRAHLSSSEIISSDYESKNLIMHTALMVSRIQSGCEIETNEHVNIPPRIELFIDETCNDLEQAFTIRIGTAERCDYYLHLLANTSLKDSEINEHLFKNDFDEMLDFVYRNYGFNLRDDSMLKNSLIEHLTSTFQVKDLKVNKRNPLLTTIRTNFPLAFEIALASTLNTFDTEPYTLTEDDVGYVALHIGTAIERRSPNNQERWHVLLVCGSGNSIARMLESRINTLFGDKLQVLGTISYREFTDLDAAAFSDIAFVVTTVPLGDCQPPVPYVLVDFSLGRRDTEAVSRLLNTIESQKASKIGMFFDADLFVRIGSPVTKGEVLSLLCERLEKKGVVGPGFLDAVLERETLSDTSMAPAFAIPHSINTMGLKTQVAVAVTDEPLDWSPNAPEVHIVFLLSVRPGDRANIEHLYDLLLDVTNNKAIQHDIIWAKSFSEFMAALSKSR